MGSILRVQHERAFAMSLTFLCSNDPGEPLRILRGEQFRKEHHELFNRSPCWVFFGEEEDFGIGAAGEPNHQKRHAAGFASTKDSLDA